MNGWDFDWVFGLGGVVVIAVLVAIRAYATGFFTKAGEHAYEETKERVSPTPEEPKPPIVIRSDFLDAPENIKALLDKYTREKYKQELLHPSDRSEYEAKGWFAPLTTSGEEVSTVDTGPTKIWFVKKPETP